MLSLNGPLPWPLYNTPAQASYAETQTVCLFQWTRTSCCRSSIMSVKNTLPNQPWENWNPASPIGPSNEDSLKQLQRFCCMSAVDSLPESFSTAPLNENKRKSTDPLVWTMNFYSSFQWPLTSIVDASLSFNTRPTSNPNTPRPHTHTHPHPRTGSHLGTTFDVPQGILDELQMYENMLFQDFLPHASHC